MDFKDILRAKMANSQRENTHTSSYFPNEIEFLQTEKMDFPQWKMKGTPYPRPARKPISPSKTRPEKSLNTENLTLEQTLALSKIYELAGQIVPSGTILQRDIAKMYHQLIKTLHPDRTSDQRAHERFLLVVECYSTLSSAFYTGRA